MEPATLTATAIATLAFTKFLEGSAGKAAETFTEAAITKMDELRKRIWAKLRGRPGMAAMETKIEQAGKVSPEQMEDIAAYLRVVMREDPDFATEIKTIAHHITLMQVEDNSSMTQTNYGGTNSQNRISNSTVNQAGTINQYYHQTPPPGSN